MINGENRKTYLDNMRLMIILGLFLFHSCEMFYLNEGFYIEADKQLIPTLIYNLASPWYMGVLFFIAGMASMLSLKKRTMKIYCQERVKRIMVPLLTGVLCWVPFQSYFVLKNHSDFVGNVSDAWKYFFTHGSLFSYGYHGEFTLSHLWFLLSLFVISLVCIPVVFLKKKYPEKMNLVFGWDKLIVVVLLIYIVSYGTSDESTLKFIVFYLLGVVLYDNDSFFIFIEKHIKMLVGISLISDCLTAWFLIEMKHVETMSVAYALMRLLWACSCVITAFTVIGLGRNYLNFSNNFWKYWTRNSFMIYFVHMVPLIAIGYYVITYLEIWYPFQILIITFSSLLVTIGMVKVLGLITPFRKMFGMAKK
ncbi:MAG: acyltransferase family protein [Eubacterium sp.]|nr:acyltransferase family protein [Eubacterium sp.]